MKNKKVNDNIVVSGTKANNSGLKLEREVEDLFLNVFNGIIIMHSQYIKVKDKEEFDNSQFYLIKNYPYISIYNSKCYSEFVLFYKDKSIRIECKHQVSSGSVDEKFAYLYLNAVMSYPENNVLLLVDGGGYRAGARQWLQDSIDNNLLNIDNKNIELLHLNELSDYFNNLKTEYELSENQSK